MCHITVDIVSTASCQELPQAVLSSEYCVGVVSTVASMTAYLHVQEELQVGGVKRDIHAMK